MTSERECYVFVTLPGQAEFVVAGRFRLSVTPDGPPLGRFVYGSSYLSRPDAVELDPVQLRLTDRVYKTTHLNGSFGAIRDSTPDSWGRQLIEERSGGTRMEEFDWLMSGFDDRAGALAFAPGLQPPHPRHHFSSIRNLAKLQAAADAVLVGEEHGRTGSVGPRSHKFPLEATSLGGDGPKAVVQDRHTLWIAKFARRDDRWNNPRVEHAMLRLARQCGLNAAASRIKRAADRDVLLVRRFDREWTSRGYTRSRMVSALTLLGADNSPADKQRWSYLALADEIRRASSHPRQDLHELFGRICFNAAISNLDDHPRNHSIVANDRRWRLSPAYDLTPMPVTDPTRRDLPMICGPAGRWANRENLLGSAGRFLLNRAGAEAVFDRVVATIRSSWQDVMRDSGVSQCDCDLIRPAILYDGLFAEG